MTIGRASGKIILLGEHAVVYGMPALVAGLPQGAEAQARPSDRSSLLLGDSRHWSTDTSLEGRAFAALLAALHAPPAQVSATLQVPAGAGLGASAALGVAVARAIAKLTPDATDENADRVLAAAAAWEQVFHGNASGIDATAALRGGVFRFSKATGPEPIELSTPLHLGVAIVSRGASTRAMVEQVAAMRSRKPESVDRTLEAIESLVNNAGLCLKAGDGAGLGKLMDLNHMLLTGLFLSTPELEGACKVAREAGALGAKLTGGGGGGAVIALLPPGDPERVLSAWREHRIECFETSLSPAPSDSAMEPHQTADSAPRSGATLAQDREDDPQ